VQSSNVCLLNNDRKITNRINECYLKVILLSLRLPNTVYCKTMKDELQNDQTKNCASAARVLENGQPEKST